ncbi:MAG: hypothetical protein H6838_01150 [Planctomycetes bacterium]|nr:hypothetical protein [Planctomycetota bacterium]
MLAESKSHPDRHAATLVQLASGSNAAAHQPPGLGARDCRIDQKLLLWRARRAMTRSEAARAHLDRWPEASHPDLWAGTVRDGVARGFSAALEEVISLASPEDGADPFELPADARVTTGKDLRRRRDVLLASGGARCRFSRKTGLLFVDRESDVQSANCLRFEARRDCGSLDHFEPDAAERPRLFSAQFLQPELLAETSDTTLLRLVGRLGRGPIGWRCALTLVGRIADDAVHLRIELPGSEPGWRLRARFLGLPSATVTHHCTDVREEVAGAQGRFVAYTLSRACGVLHVDGQPVAVPGASDHGPLVHDFDLR